MYVRLREEFRFQTELRLVIMKVLTFANEQLHWFKYQQFS
jgi:hypothetical protein